MSRGPFLGLDLLLKLISEMLMISKEIRIFPLLNLNAAKSEVLDDVIEHFKSDYRVAIDSVDYEFQKEGNQMLSIKEK